LTPSASADQKIGVTKNATWTTLATIGGTSRKRALIMPSSRLTETPFKTRSAIPGSSSMSRSQATGWGKSARTIGTMTKLCARTRRLR
jgi:hypothetical protein